MPLEVFWIFFFASTTLISLVAFLRANAKRKQLEDRLWGLAARENPAEALTGAQKPRAEGARMEQLEYQVDQIGQQMERLVESQEFLSRLIADRTERLPDPRLRTPH